VTLSINLIPRERRLLMRLRARRRLWIIAGTGYALFAGVAAGVAALGGTQADRSLDGDLEKARAERRTAQEIGGRLAGEIAQLDRTVDAHCAIVERPDWSILLTLLAQSCGDEIVLSRCSADARPQADESERLAPIVVELDGFGRDQESVTRFVLRMEELPVFAKVKLRETRREPFGSGHATAFRLRCEIDAGEEES
jgi:hypothetical protein